MGESAGSSGKLEVMRTENEVIDAVRGYLESAGWEIISYAHGQAHGHDILARRGARELIVEAKGEGSGTTGTKRHGTDFSSSQVTSHIARAIYVAMKAVANKQEAAIALPSTAVHERTVSRVKGPLSALGIAVYWVHADRSVSVES